MRMRRFVIAATALLKANYALLLFILAVNEITLSAFCIQMFLFYGFAHINI